MDYGAALQHAVENGLSFSQLLQYLQTQGVAVTTEIALGLQSYMQLQGIELPPDPPATPPQPTLPGALRVLSFDSDVDTMLSDTPYAATVGDLIAPCFYEQKDEATGGFQSAGRAAAPETLAVAFVTVKTSTFQGVLRNGTRLLVTDTWSGTQVLFTILHAAQNGAFTDVFLQQVSAQ